MEVISFEKFLVICLFMAAAGAVSGPIKGMLGIEWGAWWKRFIVELIEISVGFGLATIWWLG